MKRLLACLVVLALLAPGTAFATYSGFGTGTPYDSTGGIKVTSEVVSSGEIKAEKPAKKADKKSKHVKSKKKKAAKKTVKKAPKPKKAKKAKKGKKAKGAAKAKPAAIKKDTLPPVDLPPVQ
ncbi:MAG: hypothetical protein WDO70_01855 [Alphaproteobacteria bacterium]